ncbi:hypothetical protein HXX76_009319 [Chlamydomonas incerta]|uniref:Uncharacterized protein n=1 Tax=Chlamydomonas incerta TaxID=51695 RepID=A0A835T4Z9_CHLIN|nr:hypothetical protein HXX76_009319 [Chlamydomonas incerta]|eukprot:KAG2431825.1 hypothetical protein HXX76_009319 [Chlamydomonas incerta]
MDREVYSAFSDPMRNQLRITLRQRGLDLPGMEDHLFHSYVNHGRDDARKLLGNFLADGLLVELTLRAYEPLLEKRLAANAASKQPAKKRKAVTKKLTAEEEWEQKLKEAEWSAPKAIVQDGKRFLPLCVKCKTQVKACWISQSYALKLGSAGIKWGDCKKVFQNKDGSSNISDSFDLYRLMRGWFSCYIDETTKVKDLGAEFLQMDPVDPVAAAIWDKLEAMVQTYCENYQSEAKWSAMYGLQRFEPPKVTLPGMTADEIRGVLKDNASALHRDWYYFMKARNPPMMARLYNGDNNATRGTPVAQLGGVATPLTGAGGNRAGNGLAAGDQQPAADVAAPAAGAAAGAPARGEVVEEQPDGAAAAAVMVNGAAQAPVTAAQAGMVAEVTEAAGVGGEVPAGPTGGAARPRRTRKGGA